MPWGNEILGTSKYYIHAYGAALTVLAEIMGITPSEANEKLKSVQGFGADAEGELDQIIWEKIVPAFPDWSAQFLQPYNNETVLDALSKGQFVIVFTDGAPVGLPGFQHAVRYVGNGRCHDPFTGTDRPTSDFPDVKSFVVLTRMVSQPQMPAADVTPPLADPLPTATENSQPVGESSPAVTLVNLPAHEKEAIVKQLENATVEIKKLLGL